MITILYRGAISDLGNNTYIIVLPLSKGRTLHLLDGGVRRLRLEGLAAVVVYFNCRALKLCELVKYYLSTILSMFFVDFKRLYLIFSFHC
jgi:hypothetical protein